MRGVGGSLLLVASFAGAGFAIDAQRGPAWGLAAAFGAAALAWRRHSALIAAASAMQVAAASAVMAASGQLLVVPFAARAVGVVALIAAAAARVPGAAWPMAGVGVGAVGFAAGGWTPALALVGGVAAIAGARAAARSGGPGGGWLHMAIAGAVLVAAAAARGSWGVALVSTGMFAMAFDCDAAVPLAGVAAISATAAFPVVAAAARCASWIARESAPARAAVAHCDAAGVGAVLPDAHDARVLVCAAVGLALVAAQSFARTTRAAGVVAALLVVGLFVVRGPSAEWIAALLLGVVAVSACVALVSLRARDDRSAQSLAVSSLLCASLAAALAPALR